MLKHFEIKNYALIDHVELEFDKGLTIITGETGAGKSILLGGMELILGKRARQGLLKNPDKKSIVEAEFDVQKYRLKNLFENNELDYEDDTFIRRELLPGGKSRAFVNDSPVRLESLAMLTEKLIDIHSQHQTLELNKKEFQFDLIDSLANNESLLNEYKIGLKLYKKLKNELDELKNKLETAHQELEYKSFQLEELKSINLEKINPEEMETRLKLLENAEEIGRVLQEALQKMEDEQLGIYPGIVDIKNNFQHISSFGKKFEEVAARLESVQIELADLSMEIAKMLEENEFEPFEKENLAQIIDEYNRLLIKHKAMDINDLIQLKNRLENEVSDLSELELSIQKKEKELHRVLSKIKEIAQKIHLNRKNAIPVLVRQIEEILQELSMKDTRLKIDLTATGEFKSNGMDEVTFLLSSNQGKSFGEIKKMASGGELSRIMLAVKTVLSEYKKLPTIIFDEIDAGISGEVAQNMARVLKKMSKNMQVIVITHLPQIAAAGKMHYKVYKENKGEITTQVKKLDKNERIMEIAEMIEGKNPSASAIQHATHLLD